MHQRVAEVAGQAVPADHPATAQIQRPAAGERDRAVDQYLAPVVDNYLPIVGDGALQIHRLAVCDHQNRRLSYPQSQKCRVRPNTLV